MSEKDFIANASHELKTPITVIRGFAETLRDHPMLSQDNVKEIADKLVRTSIRLEKVMRSLLNLADAENSSRLYFRQVNLRDIAEDARKALQTTFPGARVEVVGAQAFVLADPDLVELALMNLLENAVKYSEGVADIQMTVGEGWIEVADRGIGIPAEELPYVFERFYAVNKARSRKVGGAGLGLSIVKAVMEKHGGKVTVRSELGKGSAFTLKFGN